MQVNQPNLSATKNTWPQNQMSVVPGARAHFGKKEGDSVFSSWEGGIFESDEQLITSGRQPEGMEGKDCIV